MRVGIEGEDGDGLNGEELPFSPRRYDDRFAGLRA
jgi:hypothetical protein